MDNEIGTREKLSGIFDNLKVLQYGRADVCVCACVCVDFEVLRVHPSLPYPSGHLSLDVTKQMHETNIYADLVDVLKKAWPIMIPITWDELHCSAYVIIVH